MALKSAFSSASFCGVPVLVALYLALCCGFWLSMSPSSFQTVEASGAVSADICFLPTKVQQALIKHYPGNPSSVQIPSDKVTSVFTAINNESGHFSGKDSAQFYQFLMRRYQNNMPEYWNRESMAQALRAFDQEGK